jgi:hypothetical protein
MIITAGRNILDANLGDPRTTVFLLVGPAYSKAAEIHNLIESKPWDEWQHWYLITNVALLSDDEQNRWFSRQTADHYAVVGGTANPKTVVVHGPVTELFNQRGKPGYLKIRDAFLKGDQA